MNYLLILRECRWDQRILLLMTTAVVVVWPIPDTTALRYSLLALLLLISIGSIFQRRGVGNAQCTRADEQKSRGAILLFVLLASFTIWAYVQAVFISPFTAKSLHELNGQWILQLACFVVAISVFGALNGRLKAVLYALFWGLWILLFSLLAMSLWRWGQSGVLPDRWGGLAGTLRNGLNNMSMTTVAFWMFLVTDAIVFIKSGRWYFHRSIYGFVAVLALTLFGLYIENMRTALVVIGVISVIAALPFTVRLVRVGNSWNWGRLIGGIALVLVMVGLVGTYVSRDPRWNSLAQTLPIAWNIQGNKAWREACNWNDISCVQRLPNGGVVDASNYLRVAWLHASIDEFLRNPLGVGYGREAFGNSLRINYPHDKIFVTRAENSFWTMAIGVGIPGVFLLFAFFWYMLWFGCVRIMQGEWVFVLLPILLAKTFIASFSRFVLFNSNMEFLMFILGVFAAALVGVGQARGGPHGPLGKRA